MKILVTGGLGFVGSHLVDALVNDGHDVTVVDNLVSDSSSMDNRNLKAKYWIGDIRDMVNNRPKYNDADFDVIYHLAALARIQPSFKDPLEYLSVDALGTATMLEYARTRKSKPRFVYAGSSSAFGGPMLNPYAFAKFQGEETCRLYSSIYDLSTVTARFFNVYGPRQPITGGYATIIGIFEGLMKEGKKLTVTGDGEQRRDFTHVSDIVNGLISLSRADYTGQVYQLGTGRNYSINEIAALFGREVEYIPSRPGEARITLADPTTVNAETGWQAKVKLEDYIEAFLSENYITHHPV